MVRLPIHFLAIAAWAGAMLALPTVIAPAADAQTGPVLHQDDDVAHTRQTLEAGRTLDVSRARDGLFYLTAEVNGRPTRFLVDTGSSIVLLSPADAHAAGVSSDDSSSSALITANGTSSMRRAKVGTINLGGRRFSQVDAAISSQRMPVSLMGQSLLSKLGHISLEADHLRVSVDEASSIVPAGIAAGGADRAQGAA